MASSASKKWNAAGTYTPASKNFTALSARVASMSFETNTATVMVTLHNADTVVETRLVTLEGTDFNTVFSGAGPRLEAWVNNRMGAS